MSSDPIIIDSSEGPLSLTCSKPSQVLLIVVARKVLIMIGTLHENDIKNEIRALEKLCSNDRRHLLVRMFHHQAVEASTSIGGAYQIDMELCRNNLQNEIKGYKEKS